MGPVLGGVEEGREEWTLLCRISGSSAVSRSSNLVKKTFLRVCSSLLELMFVVESCVRVRVNCSLLTSLKKIEAGQLVSLGASPDSVTWRPLASSLLRAFAQAQHIFTVALMTFLSDNPSLWGVVLFTVAWLVASLDPTHWMPVASPHPVLAIEHVSKHWQMSPENQCYSCPACLAHTFPIDPYFYLLAAFKSQGSSYPIEATLNHLI